jgi:hypothetical protein
MQRVILFQRFKTLSTASPPPHTLNPPALILDFDRARLNYYDALKEWNTAYIALLATVDYDLDQQVYSSGGN